MHPEPSDYAAFEHTIARDCRGGRRARRSARAPSISKAPAYFTVSTGPKATSAVPALIRKDLELWQWRQS
jgi:hypothetical protein